MLFFVSGNAFKSSSHSRADAQTWLNKITTLGFYSYLLYMQTYGNNTKPPAGTFSCYIRYKLLLVKHVCV